MNVGISESAHVSENMYKFRSVILRSGHLHFFNFGGGGSPFLTSISGRGCFTVKLTGLKWQGSSCH